MKDFPNNMLKYTDTLIELLASSNSHNNDLDLIALMVSNSDCIDSHKVNLVLSLIDSIDNTRYEAFKILDEKINALTVEDLVSILSCFEKDEYKYEIIIKTIKKCLPCIDYNSIVLSVKNETLQVEISRIIDKTLELYPLDNLLTSLKSFPENERLELLEKSIAGTGVRLEGSENYCELLLDLYGDGYSKSCEILGINPEIYEELI